MNTDETGYVERVVAAELALFSPEVRRAADQVEELLDPEFREIGTSGRLWTRPAMVSALTEEGRGDRGPIAMTELESLVVGPDLILVTYVSERRGRLVRRSSLWRRSEGAWRLLHHQGTPCPEP